MAKEMRRIALKAIRKSNAVALPDKKGKHRLTRNAVAKDMKTRRQVAVDITGNTRHGTTAILKHAQRQSLKSQALVASQRKARIANVQQKLAVRKKKQFIKSSMNMFRSKSE